MKRSRHFRFSDEVYDRVRIAAIRQNRTITNYVETAVKEKLRNDTFKKTGEKQKK